MINVADLHDCVDDLLDAIGRGAKADALALADGVVEEAAKVRDALRYELEWKPQALNGFSDREIEAAEELAKAAGLDVIWVVSSVAAIQATYQVAIDNGEVDAQQLTQWRQCVRHRVAHREQLKEYSREARRGR